MNRNQILVSMIAVIGLLALLVGPVQAQDLEKRNFGRSFESAKYKQIINPKPEKDEAVEGLDGQAALKIMDQYRKSFDQKAGGAGSQTMTLDLSGLGE